MRTRSNGQAHDDLACRHCGATEGFFVNVEVTGDGWCEADVSRDADGKLSVETFGGVQEPDLEVSWIDEVGCNRCDKRVPRSRIGDLIGPRYQPKVGDRVTLPDGLDGVIDEILPPRWRSLSERDPMTYVLIDGREYPTKDLDSIEPNPNQLDLLAAAA